MAEIPAITLSEFVTRGPAAHPCWTNNSPSQRSGLRDDSPNFFQSQASSRDSESELASDPISSPHEEDYRRSDSSSLVAGRYNGAELPRSFPERPRECSPATAALFRRNTSLDSCASIHDLSSSRTKSPAPYEKPERVKRPMNAFMLWSQDQRRRSLDSSEGQERKQRGGSTISLSRSLGYQWNMLSDAERRPFEEKAEQLKLEHKLAHPTYKYLPKKKSPTCPPTFVAVWPTKSLEISRRSVRCASQESESERRQTHSEDLDAEFYDSSPSESAAFFQARSRNLPPAVGSPCSSIEDFLSGEAPKVRRTLAAKLHQPKIKRQISKDDHEIGPIPHWLSRTHSAEDLGTQRELNSTTASPLFFSRQPIEPSSRAPASRIRSCISPVLSSLRTVSLQGSSQEVRRRSDALPSAVEVPLQTALRPSGPVLAFDADELSSAPGNQHLWPANTVPEQTSADSLGTQSVAEGASLDMDEDFLQLLEAGAFTGSNLDFNSEYFDLLLGGAALDAMQ
eukprot:m.115250 g.115250  ORF g.115250 m.115250 type:complete len:510 (-) comp51913_c1_seq1:3978-5507(-)